MENSDQIGDMAAPLSPERGTSRNSTIDYMPARSFAPAVKESGCKFL